MSRIVQDAASLARPGQRWFWLASALFVALVVFVGFSPTFYLRNLFGTPQLFAADILRPNIGNVTLQWWLDGAPIPGATADSYEFTAIAPSAAMRTLQLRATDQTALVHPDMAEGLLEHTRSWTLQVSAGEMFRNGFE